MLEGGRPASRRSVRRGVIMTRCGVRVQTTVAVARIAVRGVLFCAGCAYRGYMRVDGDVDRQLPLHGHLREHGWSERGSATAPAPGPHWGGLRPGGVSPPEAGRRAAGRAR